MFLSCLLIDVGEDPDRPRPGRLWLRNLYHVHQRLCMAFPSACRRSDDEDFLKPFKPEDFAQQVHVAREPEAGFLFRIDAQPAGRVVVLVQCAMKPDWDYAFGLKPGLVDPRTGRPIGNAGFLLAAPPAVHEYHATFQVGEELRFRIRVNPSKKSKTSRDGHDLRKPREGLDAQGRPKGQSKRVSLTWRSEEGERPEQVIRDWFARKAWLKLPEGKEPVQAFTLRECNLVHLGWVAGYRPKAKDSSTDGEAGENGRQMKFRSALLEGTLVVTDAAALARAIASGIGPGKAFGFGLLSVARA